MQIPSLDINSTLLKLGRDPDLAIQVPKDYDRAGWYIYGPTPGEVGAAIILGHVDSKAGPAVFYRLGELRPGDRIRVRRADKTTATFRVDGVRQYAKKRFPSKRVFGSVDYPGLRLITCGGRFDTTARSYDDNIVVYAQLDTST